MNVVFKEPIGIGQICIPLCMRRQFLHPQFIIDDDGQLVVIISTKAFLLVWKSVNQSSSFFQQEKVYSSLSLLLFFLSLILQQSLAPTPTSKKILDSSNFLLNKTTVYSVVAKVEGIQPCTMRTSDIYAQSSNAFALIGQTSTQ